MSDESPKIPERIGPYRILRKLGAGGMADVYLGVEEGSDLEVAVKVLPLDLATQKQLVRRFKREFETCRRIDHPNVVHVHGWGKLDRGFYYAMEYLPHPDLAQVLEKEAPLPLRRSLSFARDMASAFTAYHPMGLAHRDLKPANVIVADGDRLVLVDFGLVKDENVTQMTRTGAMIGTPQYMSPELVKGTPAGPPSDVFQLGLILFECLTGVRAFDGDSVMEIVTACIGEPHPALANLRPDLPPQVESLIDDCLAKAEEERPEATELLRRLEELLARTDLDDGAPAPTPTKTAVTGRRARAALASSSGLLRRSGRNLPPPLSDSSLSRSRVPPTWTRILVAAATLLVLLATGAWMLRPAEPFLVRQLHVQRGLRTVELSWTSKRPYPTVVEWADADAGSATRWTGTVSSSGAHRVRIPHLRPGRDYRWWVLFPDGTRSLRQKLELEKLELLPVSCLDEGDGISVLRWTSNIPVQAKLRLHFAGGRSRELSASPKVERDHALPLPPLEEELQELELLALCPNGEEEGRKLGPWFAERARVAVGALDFDAKEFIKSRAMNTQVLKVNKVSKMNFDVAYLDPEKREAIEKDLEKNFQKALGARGALSAVKRLRAFLPFLVESAPLEERLRLALLEAITRHNLCLQHLLTQKLRVPPRLYLDEGFLGPRRKTDLANARTMSAYDGEELVFETPHPLRKTLRSRSFDLLLPQDLASRRAELALRVWSFSSSSHLKLHVNGKGPLFLYPPRRRSMKGRLLVGLPGGWLRPGPNELLLSIELTPGCLGTKKVVVRRMRMRFAP